MRINIALLFAFFMLYLLFLAVPAANSSGYGGSELYFELDTYGIRSFILQAPEVYINTSFWAKATAVSNDTYNAGTFNMTVDRPSTFSIIENDASQPNPALAGDGSQWIANWTFNATAVAAAYTINVSLPFFDSNKTANVTLVNKPTNWSNGTVVISAGGPYNNSETGIIYAAVKDSNDNYVNIIGECNIAIYWPNGTEWKSNKTMSYLNGTNGQYYYNFVAHASVNGTYDAHANCTISIANNVSSFNVTGTNEDSGGGGSGTGGGAPVSGGGGGSYNKEKKAEEATYMWKIIPAGGTGIVKINKPEIDLKYIIIYAKEELIASKITIRQFFEKPPELPDIDENVYRYLEFKPANMEEDYIHGAKISFKVSREWLTANNIDEDSIMLNRLKDGIWVKLPTKKLESNDSNADGVNAFEERCDIPCMLSDGSGSLIGFSPDPSYIYYEAVTPGFSYFIIAGKALPVVSEWIDIMEYPISIRIEQGAVEYKHVKIKNIGDERLTNVYLTLEGIDERWYTIDPAKTEISPDKEEIFIVKFMIPEYAEKKAYSAFIHVVSDQAETIDEIELEVIEPSELYAYVHLTQLLGVIVLVVIIVMATLIVILYHMQRSMNRIAMERRMIVYKEIKDIKEKLLKKRRSRKKTYKYKQKKAS
ncbi:MAG: PGF-pre-PGF domain-containing protein [Nanoarchaeota archaeon]